MTDLAAELTVVDDSVFRLIVEEIPHIVWMATPDGAMEYVNRQGRAVVPMPILHSMVTCARTVAR